MGKKEVNTKIYYGSISAGSGFSLMILAYLVFSLLGSALLSSVGVEQESVLFYAISGLFSILALGLMVAYYSFYRKENVLVTSSLKKFNPIYIGIAILLAGGMFLGFGFVNDLVAKGIIAIGGKVSSFELILENIWHFLIYVLVLAILPAIFEEVFFRGFLLNSLNGMKTVGRVLTVAFCFALFHGQLNQFVYQFIYGVALSLLTLWAGSVLPAIIVHFVNNFAIILLEYLGVALNLYAWWIILIGVVLLIGFGLLLYVLYNSSKLKEEKDDKIDAHMRSQISKRAHKEFWLPYGMFGGVICLALVVANVLM